MIHERYYTLKEEQEKLLTRKNEIDTTWYNGVYDRYKYPVALTPNLSIKYGLVSLFK